MNICGVLVHARPGESSAIADALRQMPGVELHNHASDGRIVVTVEDTAASQASDQIAAIHALPGVIAAALVYHHFEACDGACACQGDGTP